MVPLLLVLTSLLVLPYLVLKFHEWTPSLRVPPNVVTFCERFCATARRTVTSITVPWYLIGAAVALALVGARVVIAVLLVAVALLIAFGEAWLREFRYLIALRDDAFPGHNDKLIWGLLLVVMPPVGLWLFRGYRESRWPEAKTASRTVDGELA